MLGLAVDLDGRTYVAVREQTRKLVAEGFGDQSERDVVLLAIDPDGGKGCAPTGLRGLLAFADVVQAMLGSPYMLYAVEHGEDEPLDLTRDRSPPARERAIAVSLSALGLRGQPARDALRELLERGEAIGQLLPHALVIEGHVAVRARAGSVREAAGACAG